MIETTTVWSQQIFRTINCFEATNVFGERAYQGNFYFKTTDCTETTTISRQLWFQDNHYLKATNISRQLLFRDNRSYRGNHYFKTTLIRDNHYLKVTNNSDHIYYEANQCLWHIMETSILGQLKISSQQLFQDIKYLKATVILRRPTSQGNQFFELTIFWRTNISGFTTLIISGQPIHWGSKYFKKTAISR